MQALPKRFNVAVVGRTLGSEVFENRWSSDPRRRYRAAEPSRLGEDVPLYTV